MCKRVSFNCTSSENKLFYRSYCTRSILWFLVIDTFRNTANCCLSVLAAVQVLLLWQCPCTSPRPRRSTSEVSWWLLTPSSSLEDSSQPASSTAPSAICTTTGGGQIHVSRSLYVCIQYIMTAAVFKDSHLLSDIIRCDIRIFSLGSYHIKCQKSNSCSDSQFKCQHMHGSASNLFLRVTVMYV